MAISIAKKFEEVVRKSFEKVPNTSVIRLPDPVQGYLGYRNISDFIIYHYPHQYFVECKSIHGNTFPLSNLTDNQYEGMLKMAEIDGVKAGVLCWWIDKDVTKFIPITVIAMMKAEDVKSIRYDLETYPFSGLDFLLYRIKGKKKRVFFDYDMGTFFREVGQ